MQNRKSLLRRLMGIYMVYFIILVTGFCQVVIPAIRQGLKAGARAAEITHTTPGAIADSNFYYVWARLDNTMNFENPKITFQCGNQQVRANYTGIHLEVTTPNGENSEPTRPARMQGGVLAIGLLSELLRLIVLVLMAMIINSLRRSIRNDAPLSKRNITYTRIIGLLILLSEVLAATARYLDNRIAAELLQQTGIAVSSSFHISYWHLFMGVLILFTAEVFAIGHKLGEEQKLTI